jgi:hypothetical protein
MNRDLFVDAPRVMLKMLSSHHLPYRGIGVMANPTVTTIIPLSTKAQLNP